MEFVRVSMGARELFPIPLLYYLWLYAVKFNCNTCVCSTYICEIELTVHGPFSVRAWSVQSPFNSRLTSVFLKRSIVKRTVHGRDFLAHTIYS